VVLDTPGGLHGWRFNDVMRMASKLIVPLQAGLFDMYATRDFLDELADKKKLAELGGGHCGHARATPHHCS
jgi:chromosome partitioning protein